MSNLKLYSAARAVNTILFRYEHIAAIVETSVIAAIVIPSTPTFNNYEARC